MPVETWDRTRQVNLDGSFYIVQGGYLSVFAVHRCLRVQSLRKPDEESNPARWIYYLHLLHLRPGRRRTAVVRASKFYAGITIDACCHSHYTPTKAAILSLMQSCAVALGKYGIRCNAILPGTIATDINKEDLSDTVKRENMIKRTVLGRLGGKF